MNSVFNKLRNLDAYPKINEDFYSRTFAGGIVTVVSAAVMLFLFLSELRLYLYTVTESKLLVDTSRGETLHINFDVTFPAVRCSMLSLDTRDISGEQHFDIRHNITKKRIDASGNVVEVKKEGLGAPKIERPLQKHGGRLGHDEEYCGSCFGAEESDDHCCNSCEEVRDAYKKRGWGMTNADLIDQCKREGYVQKVKDEEGEGCNIHGSLELSKVAGNFHFATGKSFLHSAIFLADLLALQDSHFNISHTVNKLSFGNHYPGLVNPLDGVKWVQGPTPGIYQYFIKVVPTIYTDIRGRVTNSNQYSVTEHFTSSEQGAIPGVFFIYDISPIKVTFKEEHISFLHFLTNICAIIGGIFTIAGIVDASIYYGQRTIKRKREIGKYR
ncbi:PREDICTED: endoplasmic reticulum-Golgi intermediate compartment protein 3-like [Lupinus angustifolius]|uniref:endoplasmic reticulum-Golgi intermediate compartment protein 3-like n=1 Tax=Lupinus angustifolius TaxID=3871 RepID=UPI00092E361C|nr:PREDICTED: endoplasmic reticulum-Golgi intermediate compartment protein 3-like [Lupinus angustifolius]